MFRTASVCLLESHLIDEQKAPFKRKKRYVFTNTSLCLFRSLSCLEPTLAKRATQKHVAITISKPSYKKFHLNINLTVWL